MADSDYITLGNLKRFKSNQDNANDAKFAKKSDIPAIATTANVGLVKPGSDFDIDDQGTITLYNKIALNSLTCTPSTAENGQSISELKFAWSVNKTPASQTFDGNNIAVDLRSTTVAGPITASTSKTLSVKDAREAISSRSAGISFMNKRHWFVGNYTADTISDDVINAATGELSTSKAKTFKLTAEANQHIYYAIPAAFGTPVFYVGGFEGGFDLLKTFDHKNSSGYTTSYNVYMSTNAGLGETTVEVK